MRKVQGETTATKPLRRFSSPSGRAKAPDIGRVASDSVPDRAGQTDWAGSVTAPGLGRFGFDVTYRGSSCSRIVGAECKRRCRKPASIRGSKPADDRGGWNPALANCGGLSTRSGAGHRNPHTAGGGASSGGGAAVTGGGAKRSRRSGRFATCASISRARAICSCSAMNFSRCSSEQNGLLLFLRNRPMPSFLPQCRQVIEAGALDPSPC